MSAWSGSKLFDTLMVFLKEFFEKIDFEKIRKTTKKRETFPRGQRVKLNEIIWATLVQDNIRSTGPEVIKLFLCSTQLSMKFIMLINVNMPTILGILTFISLINNTPERLKARIVNIFQQYFFCCYECLKFHAQLSWAQKKFYNLEAWLPK